MARAAPLRTGSVPTGSLPTRPSPTGPARALVLALSGWLVPGLGHFLAGLHRQGIILCALIGGSFVTGIVLSDLEAVSRKLHPYAFYAEIWVGAGTLPLLWLDPAGKKVLADHVALGTYVEVPRHNDTGVLFCAIAGLLNLLALFDLAERLLGRPVATPGPGIAAGRTA